MKESLNGQVLRVATFEDYPLSYVEKNIPKGVAFQIMEFLTEKFNFTFEIVRPKSNIYGSTADMNGSLIELLKNNVIQNS